MRGVRTADYKETMYDPLTSTYSFSCPHGHEAHVRLSAFRTLERLPGAAHPAVYRIQFACEDQVLTERPFIVLSTRGNGDV